MSESGIPQRGGGAMGMQLTVLLNMDVKRRTSFMLRSTYMASPSSLRLDSEQWSMTLPGGRAKSFRIWQNVFPSSFKYPPSILMMAGHLDSDEGRTAGMAWSDRTMILRPPPHWFKFLFLGKMVCLTEQEMQHQVAGVKLDVAMLKVAMFSTRTDLPTLPSPSEWKSSSGSRAVGLPPPPGQSVCISVPY